MAHVVARCSKCGRVHAPETEEVAFDHPDAYLEIPEGEREARCRWSADLCHVDRSRFFVRGVMPFPVPELGHPWMLGAWAEVDGPTFLRILSTWTLEDQRPLSAMEGRLANAIDCFERSLGEPLHLHLTGPRTRPELILAHAEGGLGRFQQAGLPVDEVRRIRAWFNAR